MPARGNAWRYDISLDDPRLVIIPVMNDFRQHMDVGTGWRDRSSSGEKRNETIITRGRRPAALTKSSSFHARASRELFSGVERES
jgi:hypothetical protein